MPDAPPTEASDEGIRRREIAQQLRGLLAVERDAVADMASTATLLVGALPDLDWAGFHVPRGDTLALSPFQSRPACIRIPSERGVRAATVGSRASVVVADVHALLDHVACDATSRSELVVPTLEDGTCRGVIDLDSSVEGWFDGRDQAGMETVSGMIAGAGDWPGRP